MENEWNFNLPESVCGCDKEVKQPWSYKEVRNIKVYCEKDDLLPTKANDDAACFDLRSNEDILLESGYVKLVKTGVYLEIPQGYVGKIYSRSGLSTKNSIILANSVGIIDCDYRGEVRIALTMLQGPNSNCREYEIHRGDRIAQILFEKVIPFKMNQVISYDDLSVTSRGSGGFGSSGK
jgi:dUTP pyrophosphatase